MATPVRGRCFASEDYLLTYLKSDGFLVIVVFKKSRSSCLQFYKVDHVINILLVI